VELAITLKQNPNDPHSAYSPWRYILAAVFFLVAAIFIVRSFYGMRIVETEREVPVEHAASSSPVVSK
jgi:hypothetical protein